MNKTSCTDFSQKNKRINKMRQRFLFCWKLLVQGVFRITAETVNEVRNIIVIVPVKRNIWLNLTEQVARAVSRPSIVFWEQGYQCFCSYVVLLKKDCSCFFYMCTLCCKGQLLLTGFLMHVHLFKQGIVAAIEFTQLLSPQL